MTESWVYKTRIIIKKNQYILVIENDNLRVAAHVSARKDRIIT